MAERGAVDRAIAWLSPGWAAAREKSRARLSALQAVRAHYDGASVGRRTAGWRRVSTDANAETGAGTLGRLRDAGRDMVRNNGHAERGVRGIAHNVVGRGIVYQFRARRLEAAARAHLDSEACDAEQQRDLYAIQRQAIRTVVTSGEVLVRRRRRRLTDGLPLPFAMQVLEGDFIDTTRDGPVQGGGYDVLGIRFDRLGRRVGYWLYDEHPGGRSYRLPLSSLVPASDVAHVYRADRPGQVRGVTWFAPVLLRMNDWGDYEDAQLLRQKIAACFAAFVTDPEGEDRVATTGDGTSADPARVQQFEPGMIAYLPAQKQITLAEPPGVDGYADYSRVSLRAIAAGLGVTYELLTGDLTGVNYSSGRMGWLEFQRSVAVWQDEQMILQLCRKVERWTIEAAALAGIATSPARAVWTPPRREMIDPTKEVPAIRDAVRSGQTTLSEMVRSQGRDPEEHFAELAEDLARIDRLGLVLDSDPRKTSRSGGATGDGAPAPAEEEAAGPAD
ncbi:MAG: phage portal protein [Sneathiellaceae bacterium]